MCQCAEAQRGIHSPGFFFFLSPSLFLCFFLSAGMTFSPFLIHSLTGQGLQRDPCLLGCIDSHDLARANIPYFPDYADAGNDLDVWNGLAGKWGICACCNCLGSTVSMGNPGFGGVRLRFRLAGKAKTRFVPLLAEHFSLTPCDFFSFFLVSRIYLGYLFLIVFLVLSP